MKICIAHDISLKRLLCEPGLAVLPALTSDRCALEAAAKLTPHPGAELGSHSFASPQNRHSLSHADPVVGMSSAAR
jgi:hypothetical protein